MSIEQTQPARNRRPYRPSAAMRSLLALGRHLQEGTFTIVLPDGSRHRFEGPEPGLDATWIVHNDRVARRFITGGILGFCEAYLDGDWSTPDMSALFELTLRNETRLRTLLDGNRLYRVFTSVSHWLNWNSRRGSQKNIAYHYDLGNSFYRHWLDKTMTYSSAVFDDGDDLATAQNRKYSTLAQRIDLKHGNRVLEIGCGWGGFAEFAARDVGADVVAITISKEQFDYASARIQRAGLGEKVDVRLTDYRDVQGTFDRIASIEMFEAVGKPYWPVFFDQLRERLAPGGIAGLQVITMAEQYYEDYQKKADYIQKYIFPGGMLPSMKILLDETKTAGLRWMEDQGYGQHYARTLLDWNDRFQRSWPEIASMGFDQRFKRMWEQYLYYCAAGFKVGTIDVKQISLVRD